MRYAAVLVSIAMLLAMLLSLCTGPSFDHGVVLTLGFPTGQILHLRLVRLAAAAIVGASLSLSGILLQNLLRNPLADPYVLGLSGGASLAIMVWIFLIGLESQAVHLLPWESDVLGMGHTAPAFLGAAGAAACCFWLGRRTRTGSMDPVRMILAGVIISTITGALMILINSFLPAYQQNHVYFYLFGYISEITPAWLLLVGALGLAGAWGGGLFMARTLNIASLSDIEAASLGVSMQKTRLINFLLSSALTAISVAIAGPIGFVGLICPHISRRLVGPDHRRLLVIAPLIGATLLVLADLLARISATWLNHPVPVGVITALIGGPLFLYMMRNTTGWR